MTTALTTQQGGLPQTVSHEAAWGSEMIHSEDVYKTRIQLVQKMSKIADEGRKAGDIILTNGSNDVIGGETTPAKVVPIYAFKVWVYSEKSPGDSQFKRRKTELYDLDPRAAKEGVLNDGTAWKRDEAMNFCVVLLDDLKGESPDPKIYQLEMRSTGWTAARKILTGMTEDGQLKKPSCAHAYALSSKKTTNEDKQTYHKFEAVQADAVDPKLWTGKDSICYQKYMAVASEFQRGASALMEDAGETERVPF